jgi:tetratricopeptide (TPR) repeat protein
MIRRGGAELRVYRSANSRVNAVALLIGICGLFCGSAQGNQPDDLERSRNDEDRLAAIVELIERSEFARAEEVLAASGPVADRDPRWLNLRGLAAAGQGKHQEAIRHYEAGLRRDPGMPSLHRNLAISLVEAGVRGRALSEFQQATELDPLDSEAWLGLCTLQIRLRRADEAARSLDRLTLLAGEEARTWRAMAELADLQADAAAALSAWTWLEGNAPDAESARRLASLSSAGGEHEVALGHYLDCFRRDSGAVDCRENATRIATGLGRATDAVQYSEPVIADLSEAGYVNLLLAATQSGSGDVEAWVTTRAPATTAGWGLVALHRRDCGKANAALEAVESGLEVAETPDLLNLLGVLRIEAGDRSGAREAWLRALELDPSHGPARANLDEHP